MLFIKAIAKVTIVIISIALTLIGVALYIIHNFNQKLEDMRKGDFK